jgi:hypothetical protein
VSALGWAITWLATAIGLGAVAGSFYHSWRAAALPDITGECSLCDWEDVTVMDGTIRQPVPCPAHQDRRHAR